MKIGIYGGTFDPPHMGHRSAALAAFRLLELDRLLIIPAKQPPHKPLDGDGATPRQRLEMAALMADGLGLGDRAEATDLELLREGVSYTADTLLTLRERYPGDELYLLMGTDMFLTVQNWHESGIILREAHIVGFARTGAPEDLEKMEEHARELQARFGARTQVLHLPQVVELSSTSIRENCSGAGLWPPVWGYILRNRLYGTDADLKHLTDDQLRAVSYSMIRAKRLAHMGGTESEAVKLAKKWGADVTFARRAAILHDCTKYYTQEQHFALCERYGVELDRIERGSEKLLHAKTGAALAQHVFGEPPEVVSAIYYHTTGKGDMSLLEKIIYLADYMEPNRDFPGVEDLRRLAYEDLDAAVALGCRMSIREMEEKGREVHPNTVAALASLVH